TRRNVCELCTQRASHEGWIREGLDDATVRSRGHNGRSRSLLARLRQRRADAQALHEQLEAEPSGEWSAGELPPQEPRSVHAIPTNAEMKMARALDLFNASAHPRTVASSSPSRIQPSWEARWVHSSHTLRRVPPARKTSACSPRSSVRPQTSQDTAGMLVVIDLRFTSIPA
ncbi:MAG TPA: hypothetical protein VK510_10420, partial [Solirubrobacteraceae bacterium]|nr:hypothetical protein [Solirubrobacteraceae bacterium]